MTTVEGTVQNIIYRNEENGYTVLELDFSGELITVVGNMPCLHQGEFLKLGGAWTTHKVFGRQFRAVSVRSSLPNNLDSIIMYLSSGLIRGVGEVLAGRIVEKFGYDTFDVILNEPHRLSKVKGISVPLAEKINTSFKEQTVTQGIIMDLQGLGLTIKQAIAAYEHYGESAADIIRINPYRLIDDVYGIGFERADRIAEHMGIEKDAPFRLNNGIKHILKLALGEGHTCLPQSLLVRKSAEILGVSETEILQKLDMLTFNGEIIRKDYSGRTAVFLNMAYAVETDCARRIVLLNRDEPKLNIKSPEEQLDKYTSQIVLSGEQKEAVLNALNSNVHIITGGPGTGKTTIINAILKTYERCGITVALCAPTGRAAKRMENTTGVSAKTIHRLLEYGNSEDDEGDFAPNFMRNEDNPIEADAIIADEASMIDIFLFRSLLLAVEKGTRLIIVGDADQLPSVGAGNVLKDLMDSGLISVSKLSKYYRQEGGGNIVYNAHRVNEGLAPDLFNTGDFIFTQINSPEEVLETLKKYYADMSVQNMDIQVLCPVKKGLLGVHNLNLELKELVNPKKEGVSEIALANALFRVNDRIMQTKNNYSKEWCLDDEQLYAQRGTGVFNGDMGNILDINHDTQQAVILFDGGRRCIYEFRELEQLEHAYAVTVHKSQGSEFDAVILPLYYGKSAFLTRNLFYTALTRAKKKVIILGLSATIEHMVSNNRIERRYTVLKREIMDFMELINPIEKV